MRQILIALGSALIGFSLIKQPLAIILGVAGVMMLLIAGYMNK